MGQRFTFWANMRKHMGKTKSGFVRFCGFTHRNTAINWTRQAAWPKDRITKAAAYFGITEEEFTGKPGALIEEDAIKYTPITAPDRESLTEVRLLGLEARVRALEVEMAQIKADNG